MQGRLTSTLGKSAMRGGYRKQLQGELHLFIPLHGACSVEKAHSESKSTLGL